MKITKTKLVEIIKEELDAVLAEEEEAEEEVDLGELSDAELKLYQSKYLEAEALGAGDKEAKKHAEKAIVDLRSGNYSKSFQAYPPDAISF